MHSVGSFVDDRNAERLGSTSDRACDGSVVPVNHEAVSCGTARDSSEYTAQHSIAPVNALEQEVLHCSPHNARVGFKLDTYESCHNGTQVHDKSSVTGEPSVGLHTREFVPFENSGTAEFVEHDLSEANVAVSESLSSIDKQVSELRSSVAVMELTSIMFVHVGSVTLDEVRHCSIGDII